ncbi:MAG: exopolysaccharide biosynthesis polyprenyl glycosylphosphotransferase [Solirubrobacteraceae bacterium]
MPRPPAPTSSPRSHNRGGAARSRQRRDLDGSRARLQLLPPPVSPTQLHAPHPVAPLLEARRWSRLCRLLDLIVLCGASAAAVIGSQQLWAVSSNRLLAVLFPPLVLTVLQVRRAGEDDLQSSLLATSSKLLGSVALATLITIAADSVLGGTHAVQFATRLWAFCAGGLFVERAILTSVRSAAMRVPALVTPTLVIGAGMVGDHLVRRLLTEPRYGLRPVGFLDSDPLPAMDGSEPPIPVLGGPQDLAAAIERTQARHVILAFSGAPDYVMLAHVRECERLGVTVSLVPRLFESINQRATLGHVGGVPLLTLREISPRGWQFAVKHVLDSAIAAIVLIALAPVLATVATLVRLSSPGPMLFRQRRIGRDGRPFDLLKFRTMRVSDEGPSPSFALPDGVAPGGVEGKDRCTPVGRWLRALSLDELPQFINVLRGDMCIVGPRPERPEFVEQFTRDVRRYDDRHRVKAGITGWAQVHGLRGQTSIADRVELDNYYIQNWSVALDMRILLLTMLEITRAVWREFRA